MNNLLVIQSLILATLVAIALMLARVMFTLEARLDQREPDDVEA